jgi:hypothetical protein
MIMSIAVQPARETSTSFIGTGRPGLFFKKYGSRII